MDRSTVLPAMLALTATFCEPPGLHAQQRWPVSLEATIGPAAGWQNGGYRGRTSHGLGAEVLGALRTTSIGTGGLVTALSYAMQGAGGCTAICMPAPDGGCVPCFPDFSLLLLGVGYETANAGFRAMGGPTVAKGSTDRTRLDRDGTSAAGIQARMDWALPVVFHLSICASLRATLVPDYSGDSFWFLAGGFGLRLR